MLITMNKHVIHTPEGVRDIYGYENYKKVQIERQIHQTFTSYGYMDIQTPTFEFLSIYGDEVGTTPLNELYKFFDKEGNIMALRPDFTPSIARCASKYFTKETIPVRFCYHGNTFTNTINLQGKLNEATQMGAELIGDDSIYGDAEMIHLVAKSILSTGLTDFQLSIGQVDYFRGVCEEMGLSKEVEDELFNLITTKNYFAADELLCANGIEESYRQVISKTATLYGTIDALLEAKSLVSNETSKQAIERLEQVYEILRTYGMEQYISFDLGMLSKYHYYSGIIWKGYTYGIGDAIVTGGRYDRLLAQFGKNAPAIGFVIVIDDLMSAINSQNITVKREKEQAIILYKQQHFTQALEAQVKLREAGMNVALNLCHGDDVVDEYTTYVNNHMITKLFLIDDSATLQEVEVN